MRNYGLQYLRKSGCLAPESLVVVSRFYQLSESPTHSPVWWFDLPLRKLRENRESFYFLVFSLNNNLDSFSVLKVPNKFLLDNIDSLSVQKDKIRLHLSARPADRFLDLRGRKIDFSIFLVHEKDGDRWKIPGTPVQEKSRQPVADHTFTDRLRVLQELYESRGFPFESQFKGKRRDPYKCLVLFLLSAGVADEKLNQVCKNFFAKFPTLELLSNAKHSEVGRLIDSLGKGRKNSRYLLEAAKRIKRDYKGRVPESLDDLIEFNGVGPKVADCIVGYAFGVPAIPVDEHVKRVANRIIGGKATTLAVKVLLQNSIPQNHWMEAHEILRAHGIITCRKIPSCRHCPVQCSSRVRDYLKLDRTAKWISNLAKTKEQWSIWRKLIEA